MSRQRARIVLLAADGGGLTLRSPIGRYFVPDRSQMVGAATARRVGMADEVDDLVGHC